MEKARQSYIDISEENALLKAELERLKRKALPIDNTNDTLCFEHHLNSNLTNSLPYGIYRIRVFSSVSTSEEQWNNTSSSPVKVEFTNDRFCDILKINKHQYTENPEIIINTIYEKDKANFAKKNAEANLKLIPFKWDGRLNIDNKIIWVHFESLPTLLKNGDVIWTGVLYDNSVHKKAEQEIIIKNQELKKLNSEKDKFFSIIAHDLKSPFNAIMGFSELLSEQIRLKNNEEIEDYAEIILDSSRRVNALLTNLMEWSQSQTGRINFQTENFIINDLINDIFLLFKEIAKQKTITLIENLPKNIHIQADKIMLSTVIRNLVSNAIKFTLPEGKIIVSAQVSENEIKISISDTGVGIPPNDIGKIFCLEENLTTFGTQNEKGTGLGLVLCKEFIEKHRGKIWLESKPNVGSTFYFTIPLMQP